MQFDTELFKPWIASLGLEEGWNSISITRMQEFYDRKTAQGFPMGFVESTIVACKEFMNAIAPALIEAGPEEDTIISVLVKERLVEYVNGPQFKRYGDEIILQVGLSKYTVSATETGSVTVGNLNGTAVIAPITKEENRVQIPKLDENGNPRFKASVRLMNFDNEESEPVEVWFSFQKNLKDEKDKLVVLSETKLNGALRKGTFYQFLAPAKEAGASSSDEETIWVDMRMLPKGVFKITKVVGPKPKVYEDPTTKIKETVNKWYLEIHGIGMAEAHSSLVHSLESGGSYYQKLAELGELGVSVTEHIVDYESVTGGRKKVEYYPDFFQAFDSGDVVPVKRGIAGPERKHYMSMGFVEGTHFESNLNLGGIVNLAIAIKVEDPRNAIAGTNPAVATLPAAQPVAAQMKSAAVSGGGEPALTGFDDIPFNRFMDFMIW
jgi:hypothetical protein